jgi:polyisoprenoid-binding protein YceI
MSVATTTQAIPTGPWAIDEVHSHVGFAVKHMVVSTFRGRFDEYEGELTAGDGGDLQISGSVAVDSLVVKDENLAGHLKSPDFFDSAEHPRITFRSTAIDIAENGELVVDGDLTIKGNTHRVSARGSITAPHVDIAGNDKVGVELEAVVDRRDYGLNWNAPLPKGGFALDNDVKLQVTLELAREV